MWDMSYKNTSVLVEDRRHSVPDNISSTTGSGRDGGGRHGSARSGAAFTSTGVKHKHNTKTLSVGNWNTSSGVGKLKIHKFVGRAGLRPWMKRTPRAQPAYWGGRRVLRGGGGRGRRGGTKSPPLRDTARQSGAVGVRGGRRRICICGWRGAGGRRTERHGDEQVGSEVE